MFLILFLVLCRTSHAEYVISQTNSNELIGKYLQILVDSNKSYTINQIIEHNGFVYSNQEAPNLGISNATFWLKIELKNNTSSSNYAMSIQYPVLDSLTFYETQDNKLLQTHTCGDRYSFSQRLYPHTNFIFDLNIAPQQSKIIYIKISSSELILVPIYIATIDNIIAKSTNAELIFALYFGLILAMSVYNLSLSFLIKDISYLYYVVYIFFIAISQATFYGYPFKYIFPDSPIFINHSLIIFPAIVGTAGILFARKFLQIKQYSRFLNQSFTLFIIAYAAAVLLSFAGHSRLSFKITDISGLSLSVYAIGVAFYIHKKGFRPAKYFLIAWAIFVITLIIFIFRNLGFLPYNDFTNYAVIIGASIETLALSIALASRINVLKREKEESQSKIVAALKENDRIVTEQNSRLEENVRSRTLELSNKNEALNIALQNLKEAQLQLVESEKMASLGQLTAGIAHEINNPINFVTSSVVPLKRDIQYFIDVINKYESLHIEFLPEKLHEIEIYKKKIDFEYLKEEIEIIIKGIEEGAGRTAEIIRGLRNFSRLDEGGLKEVDIHSGIDSTLILLNSTIRDKITIIKNYGNIPQIECLAGKLNQVFMNILSNAIHAVMEKHQKNNQGLITITTWQKAEFIVIAIKDNGTGMSEGVRAKVFEPFYTTKDINQGTGLGLSIVQSIINSHNGSIRMETELGIGSEFVIYLPKYNFTKD